METEPIYGWRGYYIRFNGDFNKFVIKGEYAFGPTWTSPTLQAECLAGNRPDGLERVKRYPYSDISDLKLRAELHLREGVCECGIYSLPADRPPPVGVYAYWDIFAYCKLWGVMVEGAKGLRSQYAEITELYTRDAPFIGKKFFGLEVKNLGEFRRK